MHWSASALRERFADSRTFVWEGEFPLASGQDAAAVLVPLVAGEGGLSVMLTRRTDHLHHHPGQICLPGGRIETSDASAAFAALRETEEETGVPAAAVEVVGELPLYATSTGFQVRPVVGLLPGSLTLHPDTFEVAEIFEVPLAFLADERNYQVHRVERAGVLRWFYAVPYQGRFIWGATAGMLAMLAAFLRD